MNCWKCLALLEESGKKIGFRAECPKCGVDLHVCVNCRYYAPGRPNDCAVPNTEWVKDRQAMNFCEEFAPKIEQNKERKDDALSKAKKLFGLEE